MEKQQPEIKETKQNKTIVRTFSFLFKNTIHQKISFHLDHLQFAMYEVYKILDISRFEVFAIEVFLNKTKLTMFNIMKYVRVSNVSDL